MKKILSKGVILVPVLVVFLSWLNITRVQACDVCATHNDQQKGATMDKQQMKMQHGGMDAMGKATGPTTGTIYSTEELYTCPMHKEVITDNSDARCPLCNMKLTRLTNEEIARLRQSHPKGCPMDPIVVTGDSNEENCPLCKIKLQEIEEVVDFFAVDIPPRIIGGEQTLMIYIMKYNLFPEAARRSQTEGVAILHFIVSTDGSPKEITVFQERPTALGFGENAIKALSAMKFAPGMKGGRPVSVRMNQVIRFKLE